ncbi:hypothetical protein FACS1894188_01790 [Clostridia bacterium]|nr:hypothetical protein FACS1894188_01790 [Clostridia bacterium]
MNQSEKEINVVLGKNVRYEREKRGLRAADLAEIVGVTYAAIHLLEIGRRGTTLENLQKIAATFGLTLDELVRKQDDCGVEKDDAVSQKHSAICALTQNLSLEEMDCIISILRSLKKARCVGCAS